MPQLSLRILPWPLFIFLTACASQPSVIDTEVDWDSHRAALEAMHEWTLRGKLALRTNERAESASVVWTQNGGESDLHLSGPLGAGATQVTSDGSQLVVRNDGNTETYDISTPDAIAASTGWNLPIKALPFWVRGLPAPEPAPSATSVNAGLMHHIEQAGWQVRYERYQLIHGRQLPTRIAIENGETRARLVIRSWDLPAD